MHSQGSDILDVLLTSAVSKLAINVMVSGRRKVEGAWKEVSRLRVGGRETI